MITIGAFEAKTHLSSLLDKVEAGEEVVITRHGKAVARMVPEAVAAGERLDDTIARLKEMRRTTKLRGLPWKDLRDQGRK
ncbi:MAG: type II toxin-antitoxin system prevent-host-death family antitoxin [Rhizobiales bacterium]|nr:type II toxin-antitoxin system prevent-host-death family antitoxin [Hyphomicrobiales bacterium]